MNKIQLNQAHAEDLVSSVNTVLATVKEIKRSLTLDEVGPLGIKETARYLKMSTQSIYKEVEKGYIPHYQDSPGSKIFFYKEELDAWVRSKKRISKKEILDEADNLKIGSYGNK
jgi:excisionase family DNA binding protein